MPTDNRHTCPRRVENGHADPDSPFVGSGTDLDTYESGHGLVGQARGCSYCGSMSPDDFMQAVREGTEIGPTDKSYKLYVGTGHGKFYTQHLSEEQGNEFDQLWRERKIAWGYPGAPYAPLFIPGPSTRPTGA
jgi:hypothetical protein